MDEAQRVTCQHRVAAVLLLVYPGPYHRPHILLTRRTKSLPSHKGEIALPGGSFQPGDETLLATAMREAWEEVGIAEQEVEVRGGLHPVYTFASNYLIHPFFGYAQRRPQFQPAPAEVEEILEVPLDTLRNPQLEGEDERRFQGIPYWTPTYLYNGHRIWGATARILSLFLLLPESRFLPDTRGDRA